jgi:hypothetical protein
MNSEKEGRSLAADERRSLLKANGSMFFKGGDAVQQHQQQRCLPTLLVVASMLTIVGCLVAFFTMRNRSQRWKPWPGSMYATSGTTACRMPSSFLDSLACQRYYPGKKGLQDVFSGTLHRLPKVDIAEELKRRGITERRSCAVVSSSGRIAEHPHLGSEIDAHDVVIRFNAAETRGFETFSGSKTTIRMVNSELMAQNIESGRPLTLEPLAGVVEPIFVIRDFNDRQDLHAWLVESGYHIAQNYVTWLRMAPDVSSYLLNGAFHRYVWNVMDEAQREVQGPVPENYHNSTASTGMEGVLLALQLCETVDVYEIAPSDKITYKPHYWRKEKDPMPNYYCPHNCLVERPWLARHSVAGERALRDRGKVTLNSTSLLLELPYLEFRVYAPNCP